jgi:hypothetical protein
MTDHHDHVGKAYYEEPGGKMLMKVNSSFFRGKDGVGEG